jgi:soluble lytic murein transglycosylase-like protein
MVTRTLAAAAGLLAVLAGPALAQDSVTYKYREEDGTVWFTDRKPNGDRLKDFELLGYQGRPPARSSCRGLERRDLATRAQRVATPVDRLAGRYNVDRKLIKAIIAVESCFDPEAVSQVGALGLMQLMPATAEDLGVEDPLDIRQNLRGGVELFSRLHRRYDGNTARALAAYNAGPGAVDRHDGIPPYPETERYVRRVLDQWQAYRRPEAD